VVIFEGEFENLAEALVKAIHLKDANLGGANLENAGLGGAKNMPSTTQNVEEATIIKVGELISAISRSVQSYELLEKYVTDYLRDALSRVLDADDTISADHKELLLNKFLPPAVDIKKLQNVHDRYLCSLTDINSYTLPEAEDLVGVDTNHMRTHLKNMLECLEELDKLKV
jgi:hypothetical protein